MARFRPKIFGYIIEEKLRAIQQRRGEIVRAYDKQF